MDKANAKADAPSGRDDSGRDDSGRDDSGRDDSGRDDSGRLPPRRLRVVVVDDSAVALRSICSVVVALLGFEVVGAATGAVSGLALAVALQPDLVLLDLQMPDLRGTDVAERLTGQFPAMRVIIVSVHDTAEAQRLARLSGAHGFVGKSRLATDLRAVVARALAAGSPGKGAIG